MTTLLVLHVAVSLVAIAAGFALVWVMLSGRKLEAVHVAYLATTVLTSVSGFPLPAAKILPAHILGVLSLVVLAGAIAARYQFHLAGGWSKAYVVLSLVAFYFNFFVLVMQSFQKVPFLAALAPTQSELPFVLAHVATLVVFGLVGTLAWQRAETGVAREVLAVNG